MKLVTAIIRETQLDAVREALIGKSITRLTVTRVSGHGQQQRIEIYRGQKVVPSLIPKIKLEIALNDEFVDTTISAIVTAARSVAKEGLEGEVGDGKIFITPLEDCIRIRTGEKGGSAI
jgi:nitrogen regulatory protein P-II 1